MKALPNRRQMLLATGAAAGAAITGRFFLRPASVYAGTFLRRDVGGLTATDAVMVSYAKGVKAMQALPVSDPRSWAYQAAIHGTFKPCPCPPSWNTCEHNSEYFWSWHRMYLYFFERIVRRMSSDPGWALPFWNWQLSTQRQLPPMFRDTGSALYVSDRDPNMNDGSGSLPNSVVDAGPALGDLDFASAVQDIQDPHGRVHMSVGGWMRGVATSAQDPIFYLHHCNVDRLWNIWLAKAGGRSDPISDATWTAKSYTFFDENGAPVTLKDCDVLRAAQQLNYGYEGEPKQVNESCATILEVPPWILEVLELIRFPIPPFEIQAEPVTVQLDLAQQTQRVAGLAASPDHKLLLVLDGIEAASQPGVSYEVFLGLPPKTAADTQSRYFVGSFALFGWGVREEAHHGFRPAHFRFEANRAVATTLRQGGRLTLTIVPSGILINGKPSRPQVKSAVRIGSVSLAEGTEVRSRRP